MIKTVQSISWTILALLILLFSSLSVVGSTEPDDEGEAARLRAEIDNEEIYPKQVDGYKKVGAGTHNPRFSVSRKTAIYRDDNNNNYNVEIAFYGNDTEAKRKLDDYFSMYTKGDFIEIYDSILFIFDSDLRFSNSTLFWRSGSTSVDISRYDMPQPRYNIEDHPPEDLIIFFLDKYGNDCDESGCVKDSGCDKKEARSIIRMCGEMQGEWSCIGSCPSGYANFVNSEYGECCALAKWESVPILEKPKDSENYMLKSVKGDRKFLNIKQPDAGTQRRSFYWYLYRYNITIENIQDSANDFRVSLEEKDGNKRFISKEVEFNALESKEVILEHEGAIDFNNNAIIEIGPVDTQEEPEMEENMDDVLPIIMESPPVKIKESIQKIKMDAQNLENPKEEFEEIESLAQDNSIQHSKGILQKAIDWLKNLFGQ